MRYVLSAIALALLIGLLSFSVRGQQPTPAQKQAEYQMLNEWRKEIVRLQYTDFCASFKKPPQEWVSSVATAAQLGDPGAKMIMGWLTPMMEMYEKKGCGNA